MGVAQGSDLLLSPGRGGLLYPREEGLPHPKLGFVYGGPLVPDRFLGAPKGWGGASWVIVPGQGKVCRQAVLGGRAVSSLLPITIVTGLCGTVAAIRAVTALGMGA